MKVEWTNADVLTPCETTGKSILVIDTPKDCDGCPCLNRKLWECQADKKRRSSDEKPLWCPLKPMPKKKETDSTGTIEEYMYKGYDRGWNACLEELEK